MTLPDERTRAVLWAREFLSRLIDPRQTPRVPRAVRQEALSVLRHYPHECDMARPDEAFERAGPRRGPPQGKREER